MRRFGGFLILAGWVVLSAGCEPGDSPHNYQFFKDNPDQALSVIGECRLNGTRGMDQKRSAECDAANAAYKSLKYDSEGHQLRQGE